MSHRAGGYGASRTSSRLTGLSGPGGLDYLVLNHLGAAPAGTRVRSSQSTRWLMQVLHPFVALAPPSHRTPQSPRSHQALPLGAPTPPFLVLGSAPLALSPRAKALTLPLIRKPSHSSNPAPAYQGLRPSPSGLGLLLRPVTHSRRLQVNFLSYVQLTSSALPSLTDS